MGMIVVTILIISGRLRPRYTLQGGSSMGLLYVVMTKGWCRVKCSVVGDTRSRMISVLIVIVTARIRTWARMGQVCDWRR